MLKSILLEQLSKVDEKLCTEEDFLGFYEIENIKRDTVTAAIKDALIRMQLPLSDCRGQTYGGASNMLIKKSGVATKISEFQPKALITNCYGHSLSLSVKDVTSACKILDDTMGTVEEICILVKFSPRREKMLGSIQDNFELESDEDAGECSSLQKLSATRWTVRASSFLKILNN